MHELPEVQQLANAEDVRGVHDGGVNHHVVVDEFSRPGRVGEDAADRAGGEKDVVGTVGAKPVVDGSLVAQIQLSAAGGQEVLVPARAEAAQNRRADQPSVPRDENARRLCHACLPAASVQGITGRRATRVGRARTTGD